MIPQRWHGDGGDGGDGAEGGPESPGLAQQPMNWRR